MRASVDPDDPGYNPAHFGAKVFFEGAEITGVITADEEKRFVLVYRYDEKGAPIPAPDRQSIETETRYGAVRIDLPTSTNFPKGCP